MSMFDKNDGPWRGDDYRKDPDSEPAGRYGYLLFGSALGAFEEDIAGAGVDLPVDTGEAKVGFLLRNGEWHLGVNTARIVSDVAIITPDGKRTIAILVRSDVAPEVADSKLEAHSERSWWTTSSFSVMSRALLRITFADQGPLVWPQRP